MIEARAALEGTVKKRLESVDRLLTKVEAEILSAMQAGQYGISIDGKHVPHHLHSEFRETMQKYGYSIEHYTGCQRDPDDKWNISWQKAHPAGASKLG